MSTTKLDLVNRVLDSVGERRITDTSDSSLALIVEDCIELAIDELATSANWTCLKKLATPSSWSSEVATIDSSNEVYSVEGVYWYSSPDGSAETNYDYAKYNVAFITNEEFERRQLWNYDSDSSQTPQYWTYVTDQTIKVSPYPTDATEQGKIFVEYYYIPTVPSTDSGTYDPPDRWMRMVELRASALFALKHSADYQLEQTLNREYMSLKRNQINRDVGLPSGGYSMYVGSRRRNWR